MERRRVSFMRGIVENTIKNMSPGEREAAMKSVTQQMVSMMSETERVDALVQLFDSLMRDLPRERLDEVVERLRQ
jgi:hypothetical protein